MIVQMAKNYARTISKFLKSLLSVSKIADLKKWMDWQTFLEEIKDVQFFCKKELLSQFTTTMPIMISVSYFVKVRLFQKFMLSYIR